MDDNFAKLNKRVTSVMPIADDLKSLGMLHGEKYEEIKAEKTNPAKMRKLSESLDSGGDKVKTAFYNLLEKHEPHLFDDLGKRTIIYEKDLLAQYTATGVIYDHTVVDFNRWCQQETQA